MATVRIRTRVANPRRVTRKRKKAAGKKSPVIRRYTVKALKKELKRRGAKTNPARRKRHTKRATIRRRRAVKRNPVLIELGSVLNPHTRRKNVAKKAAKNSRRRRTARRNPRRRVARRTTRVHRRRRTRRNPVVVVTRRRRVNRRRTSNPRRRVHHRVHRRRRNPAIFGHSGGKSLVMMVGGGLVGVAATKFLPTLLPDSIRSSVGGGVLANIALTGAGAFVASWLAKKISPQFGDAVLLGGLMQTGSIALTALAPASLSSRLALSGMGDIVPANFVVPQNPIRAAFPVIPITAGNGGMGALRRGGNFR